MSGIRCASCDYFYFVLILLKSGSDEIFNKIQEDNYCMNPPVRDLFVELAVVAGPPALGLQLLVSEALVSDDT